MEIFWRGDEYEFTPHTFSGGTDNYTKFSNIDGLIFGADTESVQLSDRYEPQCFQLSAPDDRDYLVYIPEKEHALSWFIEFLCDRYFEECAESRHVLCYYHNLEYDWLQLVKTDPVLVEMVKIGVGLEEEKKILTFDTQPKTDVFLKKGAVFTGSAPHIKLRIKRGRNAFTLYIYDTFSFFPSSLDKLAKDLGLPLKKKERQEDLGKVDFRTHPMDDKRRDFEEYAKLDARITRLAAEEIRKLHQHAGMTKIRPSAPSFAINLLFHMMEPTQQIVTGSYDPNIMQLIFDTYRGGRTGGIYHGKIDKVSVFDFHSSYPASMLSLPSFSPNMAYIPLDDLSLDNVLEILKETGNAFLRVSGIEHDPLYPSLITSHNGKLTPIFGEFKNIATTGYELYVGVMSGSLEITDIHECVVLLDCEENPFLPFKVFAEKSYIEKATSAKGSVIYTGAKLKLNAAYGKLIESRTQKLIGASDSVDYLPFISGMEKEFGNYYYQKYITLFEQGRTLSDSYGDLIEEIISNFDEETREGFQYKMFGDFSISGRVYGRYVIPAAASLITGCSRARLCAAMKALDALYWDTDSVFVHNITVEAANEKLSQANEWIPENAVHLKIGESLGEMDAEIQSASGYLAGVKRYYLDDDLYKQNVLDENGNQKGNMKSAIHGIPALPKDAKRDVIEFLATGKNYRYETKPRPQKAKESKRLEDIGSFTQKWITSSFHLDERLNWTQHSDGWSGTVKPFSEIKDNRPDPIEVEKMMTRLYKKELAIDSIKELAIDSIKELVNVHGHIKTMTPGDFYYHEYKRLSRSTIQKYFRKNGLPIDQWADASGYDITELLEALEAK